MNDMTTKRDQQWCRALVEVSGTLAGCLVHVDGRRVAPSDIIGPIVSRFNEIRRDISVMVPDGADGMRQQIHELMGHLFELRAAEDQLREQWRVTGSCPCGARAEALATHPHVSGCPTARAVDRVL